MNSRIVWCPDHPFWQHLVNIVLGILLLLGCFRSAAQPQAELIRLDENSDFFFPANITALISDRKGLLWYGTRTTTASFDGHRHQRQRLVEAGKVNRSLAGLLLTESPNGVIWGLDFQGTVFSIEDGQIRPFDPAKQVLRRERLLELRSWFVDERESVHLGMKDGYYRIDSTGELSTVVGPESQLHGWVCLLAADSIPVLFNLPSDKQEMNQSAANSITLINENFEVKRRFGLPWLRENTFLQFDRLRDGRLVFYGDQYLLEIHPDGTTKEHRFDDVVLSIFEDRWKDIWVGTFQTGLHHFPNGDLSNPTPTIYLPGKQALILDQDFEGGLWINSINDALYYMPFPRARSFEVEDPKYQVFKNYAYAGDSVFFLSSRGKWGTISNEKVVYHDLPEFLISIQTPGFYPSIHFVSEDSSLYVSGERSYGVFKNGQWHEIPLPDSIGDNKWGNFSRSPLDGALWTFTSTHLIRFQAGQLDGCYPINMEELGWKTIQVLPNGQVLGDRYLNTTPSPWDASDALARQFQFSPQDYPVITWMDSALWLSKDGLLYRAGKQGPKPVFTSEHEPIETRSRLYPEGDHLWMLSAQGLSYLESLPDGRVQQRNFRFATKQNSHFPNQIFSNQGKVWVGNFQGTKIFAVDTNDLSRERPLLVFESLRVNKKDTAFEALANLAYDQNNLEFEYTAYTYLGLASKRRKTQFRYRLQGLEAEWTTTFERKIRYTTLPPGRYRFEVAVKRTSDDGWSDPISVNLFINTPIWETWWFRILLVFAGVGLVTLLVHYRYSSIRKRDALVYQKSLAEQKALQMQMNPHFIFNIMNSIQELVIKNQEDSALESISWFSHLMRKNLENSMFVSIPLRKELESLELYLKLEQKRLKGSFDYQLHIPATIDQDLVYISPMLIQPFVENAIWHGLSPKKDNDRQVFISFQLEGDQLECIIRDNGVGRVTTTKAERTSEHVSFGSKLTQERIEILKEQTGKFFDVAIRDLQSAQNTPLGTEVTLTLSV